jgi:stress response protein SCP2
VGGPKVQQEQRLKGDNLCGRGALEEQQMKVEVSGRNEAM